MYGTFDARAIVMSTHTSRERSQRRQFENNESLQLGGGVSEHVSERRGTLMLNKMGSVEAHALNPPDTLRGYHSGHFGHGGSGGIQHTEQVKQQLKIFTPISLNIIRAGGTPASNPLLENTKDSTTETGIGPKKVLTAESLVTMKEASRGGRSTRQRLGSNYLNQRSFPGVDSKTVPVRIVPPVNIAAATQLNSNEVNQAEQTARSVAQKKDQKRIEQFHKKAKELAERNRKRQDDAWNETMDPGRKFTGQVLATLQSRQAPSVSRKRSPPAGRGGGGLGVPTPRCVSVIPRSPAGAGLNDKGKPRLIRADLRMHDELFEKQHAERLELSVALQHRQILSKNTMAAKTQVSFADRASASIIKIMERNDAAQKQNRFVQVVNEHYEWLGTQICPNSITNQRLRRVIFDFSRHASLTTIFAKMWRALLHLNYERSELDHPVLSSIAPLLPLHVDLYELSFKLIMRVLTLLGLGEEADLATGMLVFNDSNFKKEYVFFDRFRFDFCSLLSHEIDAGHVDISLVEVILRQVYSGMTYYDADNHIRVRRYEDVELQLKQVMGDESELSSDAEDYNSDIPESGFQVQAPRSNQHSAAASPPIMHGQGFPAGPSLGCLLEGSLQAQSRNHDARHMRLLNNASIDLPPHQRDASLQASPQTTGRTTVRITELLPRETINKLRLLKRHHATISKNAQLRPLVTNIKMQRLADVIDMPENTKHIELLMRNARSVFNPNDQVEMKPEDLRLKSFLLNLCSPRTGGSAASGSCTKGLHPVEMDYQTDKNFVRNGQKAMILISDHIVNKKKRGERAVSQQPAESSDPPSNMGFKELNLKPTELQDPGRYLKSPRFGEDTSAAADSSRYSVPGGPLAIPGVDQASKIATDRTPRELQKMAAIDSMNQMFRTMAAKRASTITPGGKVELETIQHRRRLKQDIKMMDPLMAQEMQAQGQGRAFMGQISFTQGNQKIMRLYEKQKRAYHNAGMSPTSNVSSPAFRRRRLDGQTGFEQTFDEDVVSLHNYGNNAIFTKAELPESPNNRLGGERKPARNVRARNLQVKDAIGDQENLEFLERIEGNAGFGDLSPAAGLGDEHQKIFEAMIAGRDDTPESRVEASNESGAASRKRVILHKHSFRNDQKGQQADTKSNTVQGKSTSSRPFKASTGPDRSKATSKDSNRAHAEQKSQNARSRQSKESRQSQQRQRLLSQGGAKAVDPTNQNTSVSASKDEFLIIKAAKHKNADGQATPQTQRHPISSTGQSLESKEDLIDGATPAHIITNGLAVPRTASNNADGAQVRKKVFSRVSQRSKVSEKRGDGFAEMVADKNAAVALGRGSRERLAQSREKLDLENQIISHNKGVRLAHKRSGSLDGSSLGPLIPTISQDAATPNESPSVVKSGRVDAAQLRHLQDKLNQNNIFSDFQDKQVIVVKKTKKDPMRMQSTRTALLTGASFKGGPVTYAQEKRTTIPTDRSELPFGEEIVSEVHEDHTNGGEDVGSMTDIDRDMEGDGEPSTPKMPITKERQKKDQERLERFRRFEKINIKSKILCGDPNARKGSADGHQQHSSYQAVMDVIREAQGGVKESFNTAAYLRQQMLKSKLVAHQKKMSQTLQAETRRDSKRKDGTDKTSVVTDRQSIARGSNVVARRKSIIEEQEKAKRQARTGRKPNEDLPSPGTEKQGHETPFTMDERNGLALTAHSNLRPSAEDRRSEPYSANALASDRKRGGAIAAGLAVPQNPFHLVKPHTSQGQPLAQHITQKLALTSGVDSTQDYNLSNQFKGVRLNTGILQNGEPGTYRIGATSSSIQDSVQTPLPANAAGNQLQDTIYRKKQVRLSPVKDTQTLAHDGVRLGVSQIDSSERYSEDVNLRMDLSAAQRGQLPHEIEVGHQAVSLGEVEHQYGEHMDDDDEQLSLRTRSSVFSSRNPGRTVALGPPRVTGLGLSRGNANTGQNDSSSKAPSGPRLSTGPQDLASLHMSLMTPDMVYDVSQRGAAVSHGIQAQESFGAVSPAERSAQGRTPAPPTTLFKNANLKKASLQNVSVPSSNVLKLPQLRGPLSPPPELPSKESRLSRRTVVQRGGQQLEVSHTSHEVTVEARNGDPLDEILVKKEESDRIESPAVLRPVEDAAVSSQNNDGDDDLNQYYMSLQTTMIREEREESQFHEDRSSGATSGVNIRSASHNVAKKTPSLVSRERANIRRVEPQLEDAISGPRAVTGAVTDVGEASSLVSKASTGPWVNQYSHVRAAARRKQSGPQTQTPQSSAGVPFAAGGLQRQLDLNTEQTISNHDEHTRRFFNLISMRGSGADAWTGSGKAPTPVNRDLTPSGQTPFRLVHTEINIQDATSGADMFSREAEATAATPSTRKHVIRKRRPTLQPVSTQTQTGLPEQDKAQKTAATLKRYYDNLTVLDRVHVGGELAILNIVPRTTRAPKTRAISTQSDGVQAHFIPQVPQLDLTLVSTLKRGVAPSQSPSSERLTGIPPSQVEVLADTRLMFDARRLSKINRNLKHKIGMNRAEAVENRKRSQYRMVSEMYKDAEQFQRKQRIQAQELLQKNEERRRMDELADLSREVIGGAANGYGPQKRDQQIQEGASDDEDPEEERYEESAAARFNEYAVGRTILPCKDSPSVDRSFTDGAGDTHSPSSFLPRAVHPSPTLQARGAAGFENSTTTINLNTVMNVQSTGETPSRLRQLTDFKEARTEVYSTFSKPTLQEQRVPAVSFRKLHPNPVSKRAPLQFQRSWASSAAKARSSSHNRESGEDQTSRGRLMIPGAVPMRLGLAGLSFQNRVLPATTTNKTVKAGEMDVQTQASGFENRMANSSAAEIILINSSSGIDQDTLQQLVNMRFRNSPLEKTTQDLFQFQKQSSQQGSMPGALTKNSVPVVIPQPLQSKPSIAVNKDVEQVLRISSKPIIESPKSGSKKGSPTGDASLNEAATQKRLSPGLVKIMSPRGSSVHRSSFGSMVNANADGKQVTTEANDQSNRQSRIAQEIDLLK